MIVDTKRSHADQRHHPHASLVRAIGALLFVAAGDWHWAAAWAYLAENVIVSVTIVVWLARHDPALLKERMALRLHPDQMSWDRIVLVALMPLLLAWFVLMGLDARRFGWSQMPLVLQIFGIVAVLGCMALVWAVFRVNSFAVPQVRAQADRTQTVISTGPYAIVRHPMYSAARLYFAGTPLLLGSWLGLAGGLLLSIGLGARAVGERGSAGDGCRGSGEVDARSYRC